jgi:diacylglycerol O-acyltransferase / wax synthase
VTLASRRLGVPQLDRLKAVDAGYLRTEDHGLPMLVAALAILDGASLQDASGRLHEETVRRHVDDRTHLAPRLRQKLHHPPFAAGPPVWVDDPAFDIHNHLRFHDLGYPADEATMLKASADLNATPLDRSRPLWEIWVLTGREDGNFALLIRLHHVVADGMAALDLLGVLFDRTAEGPPPRSEAAPKLAEGPSKVAGGPSSDTAGESPRPLPRVGEVYADHLLRQVATASRTVSSARRPAAVGHNLAARLGQVRQVIREGVAPHVSLNQPVGTRRRLMLVRADLAGARATAHAHGAKVNDVVLAAMAGGARQLLQSRGELRPDLVLRVSVAASLRGRGDEVISGNQVGIRYAPLPVCEPDAVRRLQHIAAVTGPQRDHAPYQPGGRVLQRWMVRAMFRQRLVNLLMSNLPGPAAPMYFAGARVLEVFQVGLVQGNIPLSLGVLSYAGQLNFDIVADADAIPDLLVFTEGLSAALEQLGAITPSPPVV